MLQTLKTRLTNPKVLVAVASGVLLILVNLGLIDVQLSAKVMDIVNTVLGIGVTVGIFANPESHVSQN